MAKANYFGSATLLLVGAMLGGLFVATWEHSAAVAQQNPAVTQATLVADVTHLKDITPPNSHPMVDVAMFAANLWFAGERGIGRWLTIIWVRCAIACRWEVRLNPSPKGADGNPVDMANIFDGIDKGSLTKLKTVIDMKDGESLPWNITLA